MTNSNSIFMDVPKAAALIGLSERQFRRKFIETGVLKPLSFFRTGKSKQILLRKDVEALPCGSTLRKQE